MKSCRSNMRGICGIGMKIAFWSDFFASAVSGISAMPSISWKEFCFMHNILWLTEARLRGVCKHPQRSKRNAIQCIWLRAEHREHPALPNLVMKIVVIWFRATNRPISAMEMMVVAAANAATALKSHHKKRPLWGAFFVADCLLNNNNLLSLNALLA